LRRHWVESQLRVHLVLMMNKGDRSASNALIKAVIPLIESGEKPQETSENYAYPP
jgi:hypothetical protein